MTSDGETKLIATDCNKAEAIETARNAADKYPKSNVFVTWFRKTDGQHGYLNPDGNHDITGQAY